MYTALRRGGMHYAVTGCHTDSPLWPTFRDTISKTTNAPVQDRAPDDYAAAFAAAGFQISVRRFGYNGFVPTPEDGSYYPRLMDAVDYAAEHKLLFRFMQYVGNGAIDPESRGQWESGHAERSDAIS
jgi:hypothetical protein